MPKLIQSLSNQGYRRFKARLGEAAIGAGIGGGTGVITSVDEPEGTKFRKIVGGVVAGAGLSLGISNMLRHKIQTRAKALRSTKGLAPYTEQSTGKVFYDRNLRRTRGGFTDKPTGKVVPDELSARDWLDEFKKNPKGVIARHEDDVIAKSLGNLADTEIERMAPGVHDYTGMKLKAYLAGAAGKQAPEGVEGLTGTMSVLEKAYNEGRGHYAFRSGIMGRKIKPRVEVFPEVEGAMASAHAMGTTARGRVLSNEINVVNMSAQANKIIKEKTDLANFAVRQADRMPIDAFMARINRRLYGGA